MSTGQAKPKTVKTEKVDKTPKPFSPTIIVNFLNNYYRNVAMKNKNKDPKSVPPNLTFKTFNEKKAEKQAPFTIDLADYIGLGAFVEVCKSWSDKPFEDIIERTFDMKLRACLDVAKTFKTNVPTDDPDKPNAFNFLIDQLGFDRKQMLDITDYIDAISSFFNNADKLKTKIFNATFPHDNHDAELDPTGVNVIYLQHVSKFHDEVLDMIINQGLNEAEIVSEVQRAYIAAYQEANADKYKDKDREKEKDKKKQFQRLLIQLAYPKIVEMVLSPSIVEDKKGRDSADSKWINALKVVEGKGFKETTNDLTTEEKRAIKSLVKELNVVRGFIKIVEGGKNARELVCDEEGKPIEAGKVQRENSKGVVKDVAIHETKAVKVDFKKCLQSYKLKYSRFEKFFNGWKQQLTNVDKLGERQQFELFVRYLIASVKLIKTELGYAAPLKMFINDIKKDAIFKFNKNLKADLEKLIEQAGEAKADEIDALVTAHFAGWRYINSPKTYDPSELGVYGKIGRYIARTIKKEYREAIGIAIVGFIQEQIRLLSTKYGKKRDVQIYIRVRQSWE